MAKQMVTIEMPLRMYRRLERFLDKSEREEIQWISKDEARHLLGRNGKPLSAKTMSNMLSNGTIPDTYYTTGVNGSQFFDKKKLMGLE